MTQEQEFYFLVASAVGATIILSRGDIFKPFRDWIDKKSIRNKIWIHDVNVPHGTKIKYFLVDGSKYDCESMKQLSERFPGSDVVREKSKEGFRYCLWLDRPCNVQYFSDQPGQINAPTTCNVYETIEYKPFLKYLSGMLNCPQCSGLWIGMAWYVFFKLGLMQYWWFVMFCTGNIVSALAYLYFKFYTFLEKK